MSEFLEYDEIFYVFLLFIIVTVLNFFDERKSGLWQITYSCKEGRMKLAVKRLGIFLFLTLLFSFFIFLKHCGWLFLTMEAVESYLRRHSRLLH